MGVFILSMALLPWQQSAFGTGKVVAYVPSERSQTIDAPVDGRISKWHVLEGAQVKQGDPLVNVSDIDPQIMDRLRDELSASQARLRSLESALAASKSNLERQRSLFEQGLSSKRAVELAEIEANRLMADRGAAAGEVARMQVRLSRQGAQTVVAPRDGIIQRILVPEGGPVFKTGDTLGILIPQTDQRAIEVWISGNDVPLVYPGRKARIQFEGWPAVQFSGWPSVAVGTFAGKVAFVDPLDNGEGRFRVLIVPDDSADSTDQWPSSLYLRQGVRANAWVLLDTVRVGYELWRQFNGFPPSQKSSPNAQGETKK
jgi:multidrug efflux pump subunit AcrA (membrane-fusion protein)